MDWQSGQARVSHPRMVKSTSTMARPAERPRPGPHAVKSNAAVPALRCAPCSQARSTDRPRHACSNARTGSAGMLMLTTWLNLRAVGMRTRHTSARQQKHHAASCAVKAGGGLELEPLDRRQPLQVLAERVARAVHDHLDARARQGLRRHRRSGAHPEVLCGGGGGSLCTGKCVACVVRCGCLQQADRGTFAGNRTRTDPND